MSTQTIDYAALAEQARQQSAPKVDYASLAEQARSGSAPDPGSQPKGAVRRFAERALHLPEDIGEHPGAYLNPFSSEYWQKGKQEREQEKANPPRATLMPQFLSQAGEDVKSGNYAGAAGDVVGPAYQIATATAPFAAHVMQSPRVQTVLPKIGRYGGGAVGYEAGKTVGHPVIGAATGAGIGESAGHGVAAIARKAGPSIERQGLGSFRAPVIEDVPAAEEPAPAPYRASGDKLTDATTVMPRRIQTDPARLLGEGTASGPVESEPTQITPLRATSPKAAQTEILRKAGVASPAATIKPMTRVPNADITPRPDLKFSGSHSGEEAAMNQLTENVTPDRLGINELRGIAQQRGIKVSPGDNHVALYRKIQDSLTPEEIEQFEQARIERMQPDYSLPPIQRPVEPMEELPREAVSDEDRENLIMKSIQKAKSKKAGAN